MLSNAHGQTGVDLCGTCLVVQLLILLTYCLLCCSVNNNLPRMVSWMYNFDTLQLLCYHQFLIRPPTHAHTPTYTATTAHQRDELEELVCFLHMHATFFIVYVSKELSSPTTQSMLNRYPLLSVFFVVVVVVAVVRNQLNYMCMSL